MSDFDVKSIRSLCEQQLKMYMSKLRRIESGERGMRKVDLKNFIDLWKGIASKKYIFNALSLPERNEIINSMKKHENVL